LNNNKVLITGGAGFIGAHVTNHLIKLGHNVIVLDDLSGGFEDFVNNNKKIVDNICRHTSLDSEKLSTYDPNISKKNIGNFKKN